MTKTIFTRILLARVTLALGLAAAALTATLPAAGEARATTFTVNSVFLDQSDANFADGRCDTEPATSGNQCTLRAAMEQANETPGADVIRFDVPGGSGVKTIRPSSELPAIAEALTIDGYTQPGTKKNTSNVGTNAVLLIELDGTNGGSCPVGLRINASNVVIRGLVINRFDCGGIFTGGANTRIEGNFIGTDPSGTLQRFNDGAGVTAEGLNAIVGRGTLQVRNLISGNVQGVNLFDSGAKVQGNLIGTQKDGTTALGNRVGLLVPGSDNTIGGSTPGEANTIAFNSGQGILVQSVGVGNRILGNSIFSNGLLGIDLDGGTQNAAGATANDSGDADTGANNLQNKPKITSATTSSGTTTVRGRLNSTPEKTFRVQFFSNPSGTNEGKKFVGQKSVRTDADGIVSFTFTPASAVAAEQRITATATGAGNTSEFSAPRTVVTQ